MLRVNYLNNYWGAADKWITTPTNDTKRIKEFVRGQNPLSSDDITYSHAAVKRDRDIVRFCASKEEPASATLSLGMRLTEYVDPNSLVALNIKERLYLALFIHGSCVFELLLESPSKTAIEESRLSTGALFCSKVTETLTLYGNVKNQKKDLICFPEQAVWQIAKSCMPGEISISEKELDLESVLDIENKDLRSYHFQQIQNVKVPIRKRVIFGPLGILALLIGYTALPEKTEHQATVQPVQINKYQDYIDYLSYEAVNVRRRVEHDISLLIALERIKTWTVKRISTENLTTVLIMSPDTTSPQFENVRKILAKHGFGPFKMSDNGDYMSVRQVEHDVQVTNIKSIYDEKTNKAKSWTLASLQEMLTSSLKVLYAPSQYKVSMKDIPATAIPKKGIPKDISFKSFKIEFTNMGAYEIDGLSIIPNYYPIAFSNLVIEPSRKNEESTGQFYRGELEMLMVGEK